MEDGDFSDTDIRIEGGYKNSMRLRTRQNLRYAFFPQYSILCHISEHLRLAIFGPILAQRNFKKNREGSRQAINETDNLESTTD